MFKLTNIKQGPFKVIASEDLTNKEGYLAKIINSSGTPKAALPDDVADHTLYLITDGGASGESVELTPLQPGMQFRGILDGTCVAGDKLTLAAINGTKDGLLVKLPATADVYFLVGRAEESGAAGQWVKFRVTLEGEVTVS